MTAPIIHETVTRLCPHCGQPFRTVDAFREHASGYRHDVDASRRARLGKLMCATFTPFGGDKVTGSEFYGTVESCNPCQGAVVMKGAKLDIGCRSLLYGPGHPHLTVSAYRTSVDYQKPESVTVTTTRARTPAGAWPGSPERSESGSAARLFTTVSANRTLTGGRAGKS